MNRDLDKIFNHKDNLPEGITFDDLVKNGKVFDTETVQMLFGKDISKEEIENIIMEYANTQVTANSTPYSSIQVESKKVNKKLTVAEAMKELNKK